MGGMDFQLFVERCRTLFPVDRCDTMKDFIREVRRIPASISLQVDFSSSLSYHCIVHIGIWELVPVILH